MREVDTPRWYFYLDTSALLALSRTLPALPLSAHCYTSALALLELVSGLRRSERDYGRRRAALCSLANSQVGSVEILPEAMLFTPFRLLSSKYQVKDDRLRPLRDLHRRPGS